MDAEALLHYFDTLRARDACAVGALGFPVRNADGVIEYPGHPVLRAGAFRAARDAREVSESAAATALASHWWSVDRPNVRAFKRLVRASCHTASLTAAALRFASRHAPGVLRVDALQAHVTRFGWDTDEGVRVSHLMFAPDSDLLALTAAVRAWWRAMVIDPASTLIACAARGVMLAVLTAWKELANNVVKRRNDEAVDTDLAVPSGPTRFDRAAVLRELEGFVERWPRIRWCEHCHKTRDVAKLWLCTGCKVTRYCGAACQAADWPVHEQVCACK